MAFAHTKVVYSFQQVGLAHTVAADKTVESRRTADLLLLVVAKLNQFERLNIHRPGFATKIRF
jgi:hypothetical protein